MSICKLIYQELESLKRVEFIDVESLDPRKYDTLIQRLQAEVEKLELLKIITSLKDESLDTIDAFFRQQNIDVGNLKLENIIATKAEDISDTTVFYKGNLGYHEYQAIHPAATSLPPSLKLIEGAFIAADANIESLEIDYLGGSAFIRSCDNLKILTLKDAKYGNIQVANCEQLIKAEIGNCTDNIVIKECNDLDTLTVGDSGKAIGVRNCMNLQNISTGSAVWEIEISSCPNLNSAILGNSGIHMVIESCPKLLLDKVSSIYGPDHKIKAVSSLSTRYSGLAKYENEEILQKFDVDPDNIIRT